MMVLGGGRFLMSEVPLYGRSVLATGHFRDIFTDKLRVFGQPNHLPVSNSAISMMETNLARWSAQVSSPLNPGVLRDHIWP